MPKHYGFTFKLVKEKTKKATHSPSDICDYFSVQFQAVGKSFTDNNQMEISKNRYSAKSLPNQLICFPEDKQLPNIDFYGQYSGAFRMWSIEWQHYGLSDIHLEEDT